MTDMDVYISVNLVSRVTGLSRNTLYRYMNEGRLPYKEGKQGRLIRRSDAKALQPKRPAKESNQAMLDEIKQLTSEVCQLRHEVRQLSNVISVSMKQINSITDTVNKNENRVNVTGYDIGKSSNEGRQLEAIAKVQAILDKYQDPKELPSMAAMAREAGVDKGTFIKHFKRLRNSPS